LHANYANKNGGLIKIDVKDNNVEQAIRILKRKLQKEGFFKIIKMKSNYEKPSEKKKRLKLENIKRAKKFQRLRNRL
tara:strand:+ start:389 stop:619 length:231 start_codon:yes stop_codon:yes gene_type:complete